MGKRAKVVRIIRCSSPEYWYVSLKGKEVRVSGVDKRDYHIQNSEAPDLLGKATMGYVLKKDCEIIQ